MAASGSTTGICGQLQESWDTLFEQVLPYRHNKEQFLQLFEQQGITQPSDLTHCSDDAFETKLSDENGGGFNFIQVADALSLRKATLGEVGVAVRAAHFANGAPQGIAGNMNIF